MGGEAGVDDDVVFAGVGGDGDATEDGEAAAAVNVFADLVKSWGESGEGECGRGDEAEGLV